MSNEKLTEIFVENFENLELSDKVWVHNEYCRENNADNEIFENDEDFLNEYFSNPADAVRAVYFGKYQYNDPYVWFNGYANLESGEFEGQLPLEDAESMAEWFIENYSLIDHVDEMEEFCEACEASEWGDDEEEEE